MSDPGQAVNATLLVARLVVEELHRKGLRLAVLCPGSRNSPLVLAFADHGGFRLESVIDERAAAYCALGWARATGEPALVCTTSGGAVAQLLPAAVEADEDGLPLLLLAADRPPELRGTGSNQTVHHRALLEGVCRAVHDLPEGDASRPLDWLLATVDEAVDRSRGPHPGPVLLNIPFRKPLENSARPVPSGWSSGLESWLAGATPWRRGGYGRPAPDPEAQQELACWLTGARRPLLVLGQWGTAAQRRQLVNWAGDRCLPVVADLLSGLRLDRLAREPDPVIHHGDLLATLEPGLLQSCDRVIQLGGRLASPALLDWLGGRPREQLALLDALPRRFDPGSRQGLRLAIGPEHSLELLDGLELAGDPAWLAGLRAWDGQLELRLSKELEHTGALGEAGLARRLSRLLPAGHALWVANSMPVRDLARWGAIRERDPDAPLSLWCNRGASGIDGTLAAALGACRGAGRPLTVYLGDLALIHDLNSLLTVASSGAPLTVVVVNNGGGGIFGRLPVAAEPAAHPWITTPHELALEPLCAAVALPYHRATSGPALDQMLAQAWGSRRPALVEVPCPRGAEPARQQRLLERLAAGAEG